jgi:predicted transcriptional regulator
MEKLVSDFEPSMSLISKIMKVLLERNSIGKTALSQEANVNYVRLTRHLQLLEEKRFVERTVEEDRINFTLSRMGREFAMMLSMIL